MDLLTGLPTTSRGNDAMWVVVCRRINRAHLIACTKQVTSEETARLYRDHVWRHHGLQKSIVSDRDRRFVAEFWDALHKLIDTKLDMASAAHQQTNGLAEIQISTICQILRTFAADRRKDWDEHLATIEFAMNDSKIASLGETPFFLEYGRHPRSPLDAFTGINKHLQIPKSTADFVTHMKRVADSAHQAIERAQARQKDAYDRMHRPAPKFVVNDQVLLSTKDLGISTTTDDEALTDKLQRPWFGPLTVTDVLPNETYRLKVPNHWNRIHPEFHVSKLKPFHQSALFPDREEPVSPPAYDLDSGSAEYEIERIIKHRYLFGKDGQPSKAIRPPQFLVKWKDEPESKASWRTEAQLQGAADLLKEYLDRVKQEQARVSGPSRRGRRRR